MVSAAKSPPQKIVIQTVVEADALLGRLAGETGERDALKNALQRELELARTRFEPQIAALDAAIEDKRQALEDWAKGAQEQFEEKRSIELLHGTIGFRLGKHSLKLLARMTWDRVKERMTGKLKQRYIRTKEEVDKQALIADAIAETDPLPAAELSRIGVRLIQEDNFFFDLKKL